MNTWNEKYWSAMGSVIGIGLLAVIVFGIRGCVAYDRDREAACLEAGGQIGSATYGYGCYKLFLEPLPVRAYRKGVTSR